MNYKLATLSGISVFAATTGLAWAADPIEASANEVAYKQINAYAAWQRGYTGKGIKVGIVDTGADLTHPDLANVILSKGYLSPTITDVNRGHGTTMLSIMAGAKNGVGMMGVAYDAKVLAFAGGNYGLLFTSIVSNGIKWNADNGAEILNLSLGGRLSAADFAKFYTASKTGGVYIHKAGVADSYASTALMPALQYATGKGTIAVMAAGNDGNAVPTSPANLAVATNAAGQLLLGGRAVIVGAVDNNNAISKYSNRAGHICQNVIAGTCTDKVQVKDYFLVAPGSLLWGANANYTFATNGSKGVIAKDVGTSVSAAVVSGGLAVIKQAWPTLRPEQVVQVLLKTATDLGAPGVDTVYGNGLMNLDAATKPLGTLTLAKITSVSTSQIAAGPVRLASTGMAGGVLSKQSFADSAVLNSAQAVDEMGRNFTVQLGASVNNVLPNYHVATPYSVASTGSVQRLELGQDSLVNALYQSPNMSGVVLGKKFGSTYWGVETGTASERGALLGSVGAGGLQLGDASTQWTALHLARDIEGTQANVFASLGFGKTQAGAAENSLITAFSPVRTRTLTLGARQSGVFDARDSLSLQVSVLPHVVSGSATVSAVTGFNTQNITDEGATSTPITSTERIGLASDYRQYATTLSYAREFGKNSGLQALLTLQTDNAGREPAVSAGVRYVVNF
jgi:subtilisin family serine protease